MDFDWKKIKAEYIAGGTSYKKLSEKYGIPFSKIRREAEKGKWIDLRTQAEQKADTKIVNAVAKAVSDNAIKINDVADKLLAKISDTLDLIEVVDSQSIKHFTSALKDIKDIKGIKADIDLEEQKARIDKLRKEAEGEEKDTSVEVIIGEEDKKYAN